MKDVNTVTLDTPVNTLNVNELNAVADKAIAERTPEQLQILELNLKADSLDLRALGLQQEDIKSIIEIKNNMGDMTQIRVAEYGKDISSNTNNCTTEILSLVKNKETI